MKPTKERISFSYSIGIILGSLLLTGTLFFVSFRYYEHISNLKKSDPKYNVASVIQTGTEKEPLQTAYLIELMGLSLDKSSNLYALNGRDLEKKLMSMPLIKKASVDKSYPNILYVDYEVRKPLAYLKDFSNTLLGEDGVILPFKPFFSPKNFPQVYLGSLISHTNSEIYGSKVPDDIMDFIRNVVSYSQSFFEKNGSRVLLIDFSRVSLPNKEQAELILLIAGEQKEYLIRVCPDSYKESLSQVKAIVSREGKLKAKRIILDFRIKGVALVSFG